ncbi:MAG: hypothetical protein ACK559_26060, partial [bacterium]
MGLVPREAIEAAVHLQAHAAQLAEPVFVAVQADLRPLDLQRRDSGPRPPPAEPQADAIGDED